MPLCKARARRGPRGFQERPYEKVSDYSSPLKPFTETVFPHFLHTFLFLSWEKPPETRAISQKSAPDMKDKFIILRNGAVKKARG